MSKNNLLNEGTVRRFMKLANVDSLSDTFVEKLTETTTEETVEEGTVDEMTCSGNRDDMRRDEPMEEMYGMVDGDRDDDEPAMDVEVDVGEEDEAPVDDAADNDLVKLATSILDAVQDAVNSVVPGLVSVDSDEEEAMMPAGDDMMDEPEEAMMEETEETLEEETVEEAAHEEDEEKKMVPGGRHAMEETIEEVNVVQDEDLINEVAKRVTARLVKSLAARKNS
jgi:hypothetical protein